MFGAYQAGVWQVLAPHFRPDIFIGASIGALNAWALAGGCPPGDWAELWLHMDAGLRPRFRMPRSLLGGCIDAEQFEAAIRRLHSSFRPVTPCAVAITDLFHMRPWLAVTPDVDWIHLAASCGVFGVMPQYIVNGRRQTDGGLLGSVPLWATAELGVTHAVAVNILPRGGPWWLRLGKRALGLATPRLPAPNPALRVVTIEHPSALGPAREAFTWSEESATRMVHLGRRDAEAALPRLELLVKTF